MEHITKPSMSRTFSIAPGDSDNTQQLKSELVTLRRKYEKLQKKEKRIQVGCSPTLSRLVPMYVNSGGPVYVT